MTDAEVDVPAGARGYSWPPFAPGHELSTKHGALSPRKVDPIAQKLLELVLADDSIPYLREPRYRAQLVSWAKSEARLALLEQWVEAMPIAKAASAPAGRTPPLEMLRRFDAAALTHRNALGLTPASAARLGRDVAQGRHADAAAELTRMREEHEQALRDEAADG